MNNLKSRLDARSQQLNNPEYPVSEEYKKKRKELSDLTKTIQLLCSSKVLSIAQRSEFENYQFKLEFALKNLVEEFADREIDERIKSFKNVVKFLKKL